MLGCVCSRVHILNMWKSGWFVCVCGCVSVCVHNYVFVRWCQRVYASMSMCKTHCVSVCKNAHLCVFLCACAHVCVFFVCLSG